MSAEFLIKGYVHAPPETHQAILDAIANRGDRNPDGIGGSEHEVYISMPMWRRHEIERGEETDLLLFHSFRQIGMSDGLGGRAGENGYGVPIRTADYAGKVTVFESFELAVLRQTRDRILNASPTANVVNLTVICVDYAQGKAFLDDEGKESVNEQNVIGEDEPRKTSWDHVMRIA